MTNTKQEQPYNQTDHSHCWESKKPPCGQKIEHYKCCLCELPNPKITAEKEASYQEGQKTDKETKERIFNWIDKLCDTITATRLKRNIYHDVFEPTPSQPLPIKKKEN